MKTVLLRIWLLLAAALSLLNCAAGPTTTEAPGGSGSEVEGRILSAQGKPVAGAAVHLRSAQYLAWPVSGIPQPDNLTHADAVTDHHGWFTFRSVAGGSYSIEAANMHDSGIVLPCEVGDSAEKIILEPGSLKSMGTITGRINIPLSDDQPQIWVLVHGLERSQIISTLGNFSVKVPEGVYYVLILLDATIPLAMHYPDSVRVAPDSIFDIGILNVPPLRFFTGCKTFTCDSLAVRSILDHNNLATLAVDSVVGRDSMTGRIFRLDLHGRGIADLTPQVGSLSRLISLDASNNNLVTFPSEIGYCTALCSLRADTNRLYSLPAELSYLDSLQYISIKHNQFASIAPSLGYCDLRHLDLSDNQLADIPIEFCRLDSLRMLSVSGNRLCYVYSNINAWLTKYQPGWEREQQCW